MENLVLNHEQAILFVTIFLLCLTGAYAKDTLDTYTKKSKKILLKVIFLSALIIAILIWSFCELLLENIGIKPLCAVSLILGMLSYEITTRMTSFSGLESLYKEYKEFKKGNAPKENKTKENKKD